MAFRPIGQTYQEHLDTDPTAQSSGFRPLTPKQRVETALKIEQPRSIFGELLPSAFAVGGGVVGGILGAGAGGVGAIPGAVAGAAGGAAIGEGIQQGIEKKFGEREKMDIGQIGFTGLVGAATEATGAVAMKIGGMALSPLLSASKPLLTKTLSSISGYADNVLQEALKRGKGAIEGITKGDSALSDVVRRSAKGLSDYAKKLLATSKETIKSLDEALGREQPVSVDDLTSRINRKLEEANIGVESPTALRMREQGINEEAIGKVTQGLKESKALAFSREIKPSRIVSTAEQSAIKDAYNTLNSISQNQSIEHIDSVFEKLLVLRSKTPSGSPTGPETKALIGDMIDELQNFVKRTGTTNKAYSDYAKFLQGNLRERVFVNEMKELFGNTANPSPKEMSTISTRLLQMFNQGKSAIRGSVDEMGKKIGEDVTGTVAGAIIKAGDDISIRAKNLTRRGIVEKLTESVPRAMLRDYIARGSFNALEQSPIIKKIAQGLGITVKALIQEIVQVSQDKGTGKETEFNF